MNESHDNWDQLLHLVVFSYNNSKHSSTGFAPNEIIFNRVLPSKSDRHLNIEPPFLSISREELSSNVARNSAMAKEKQKRNYDMNCNPREIFKIGDQVLLTNSRRHVRHVRSFEPKFLGPFTIVRILNEVNLEIIDPNSKNSKIVNRSRLVKYRSREESANNLVFNTSESEWLERRKLKAIFARAMKNRHQAQVLDRTERFTSNETYMNYTTTLEAWHENDTQDLDQATENDTSNGGLRTSKEIENHENEPNTTDKSNMCELCYYKSESAKGLSIHKGRMHKELEQRDEQEAATSSER